MPSVEVEPVANPSYDKLKMEDRKRSLANDADDLAPRSKRLLKDENGQAMRMEAEKEKDVENYQKDAILRQMKEYKRRTKDAEEQYKELHDKTRYHEDNLRAVNAFFEQTIDEVRVMLQELPPAPGAASTGEEPYTSALLFESSDTFSQHLHSRTEKISATIKDLYSRLPQSSPDVQDLQKRLNDLLAREKDTTAELMRVRDERDALQGRLEQASYRYMTAEKKLDRAKSSQVQKLERAAMMGGGVDAPSPTNSKKPTTVKKEHAEVNGDLENGEAAAEAEAARKEALATAEKQKVQLEEIESENERLTNELSAARTKMVSLTDDDYAETALCKTIRSQYEDTVKKLNDLEATNVQLRGDIQKLQSERLSYRSAVDDEHRTNNEDIEAQIARAENDLARIRTQRDNLQAEVNVLRSSNDTRRTSAEQTKELAAARDSRIAALESELERTKLRLGEAVAPGSEDLDAMDETAAKDRLRTLEQQYSLLSNELPSMEAAWRKTQVLASKKVEEIAAMEEQVARFSAEKTKADQKYFAMMKNKETQAAEIARLKTQNARSTEIVSQLKEADGRSRELASNLERQLAEKGDSLTKLEQQHRVLDQKCKEAGLLSDGLKKQVDELKAMISSKDKESLGSANAKREAEVELEKSKVRIDDLKRQLEMTKKTMAQNNESSSDTWRKVAICSVCSQHLRDTVLKLCGHTFCNHCIKDLISNRSRKCPACGKAFGSADQQKIVLA